MYMMIDNNKIEHNSSINTIINSNESPIYKVFSIESLIYAISNFLTFEEKKTLYSVNKKLNIWFRDGIKEIKPHILIALIIFCI